MLIHKVPNEPKLYPYVAQHKPSILQTLNGSLSSVDHILVIDLLCFNMLPFLKLRGGCLFFLSLAPWGPNQTSFLTLQGNLRGAPTQWGPILTPFSNPVGQI